MTKQELMDELSKTRWVVSKYDDGDECAMSIATRAVREFMAKYKTAPRLCSESDAAHGVNFVSFEEDLFLVYVTMVQEMAVCRANVLSRMFGNDKAMEITPVAISLVSTDNAAVDIWRRYIQELEKDGYFGDMTRINNEQA